MTTKLGINGFGRIGRLAFRRIKEIESNDIEVVAINDLSSPNMLAHLLKFDSTHGELQSEIDHDGSSFTIDSKK